MTLETPSRMQVVRKQEKEPRLKDFIGLELSRMAAAGAGPAGSRCLLLARTIDGPVVRALATHAAELAAGSISVRLILSSLDVAAESAGSVPPAWLATCQVRWTRNTRLIDAHECLVIGAAATWVGDCMRRDPLKRDAFESYNPDSEKAAEQASRSFDRLWVLSEPVSRTYRWKHVPVVAPAAEGATAGVAPVAAVIDGPSIPTPSATRH